MYKEVWEPLKQIVSVCSEVSHLSHIKKKEGTSRWHLLINTKFTTWGHFDKESVAAMRMKMWLK